MNNNNNNATSAKEVMSETASKVLKLAYVSDL